MDQLQWDVPQTEEGLQQVLRQLDQCRTAGDDAQLGKGLLELSHLVKWVRSDTTAPPFVRANELALQALDVFRRAHDVKGQVKALIAGTAMTDPQTQDRMLAEAEELAKDIDDENYVGSIIAARARGIALSDRVEADKLHNRALEIFRRTGNLDGQARCLFALSIGGATDAQKLDFALEAAQIYRTNGLPSDAARCISIALMNAEEIQPLTDLEDLAQLGLKDALDGGNRSSEGMFYKKLSLIKAAKGETEEADKYRRWASEIEQSDGHTPLERWKDDVEMTKMMISMSQVNGNKDAVREFRGELKRLKANKPKK